MPSWLQWINNRVKNFDMLGSIWFANLDIMVNNVRYLHDDGDELEQSNIANKSNQSNKSKQCDKSASHNCSSTPNRTCNCAGSKCATDGESGHYFGSNTKWEYTKIRKHIWDSINDNDKLYSKLSNTKYYDDVGYRESTRNTEG